MYRNFAELCVLSADKGNRGAILELACGSGRVMLPLAQEGYMLTGVDSSEQMLALAQQELQTAGVASHCTLVHQDISTMRLGRKFHLAFIALGSFAHITTRKAQQQALAAVRSHVATGGTFIVDIS